jgi:hypothetical protein
MRDSTKGLPSPFFSKSSKTIYYLQTSIMQKTSLGSSKTSKTHNLTSTKNNATIQLVMHHHLMHRNDMAQTRRGHHQDAHQAFGDHSWQL